MVKRALELLPFKSMIRQPKCYCTICSSSSGNSRRGLASNLNVNLLFIIGWIKFYIQDEKVNDKLVYTIIQKKQLPSCLHFRKNDFRWKMFTTFTSLSQINIDRKLIVFWTKLNL